MKKIFLLALMAIYKKIQGKTLFNGNTYYWGKGHIGMLALTALVMAGCANEKINGIPLEEGSTMTYETKDYIIRYEVTGFNNFGQAIWAFKEIRNKQDSIMELKKEN